MNDLNFMSDQPVELVQEFYESFGYETSARQDNGSTELVKNCAFKAAYFAPAKGSGLTEGTEPDWKTTENGKQYCIVMGYAKVKGFSELSGLQQCLLNKASYDTGDFELNVLYSSISKIPLLDADGNKHPDFNDIYFTVFENKATNNDMSDLAGDKFKQWMAKREAAIK